MIEAFCTGCGEDCSQAYATWKGDPYHVACIPAPTRRPDPRDPDYSREGIFQTHNCPMCNSGEKPCIRANPHSCDWPHARND